MINIFSSLTLASVYVIISAVMSKYSYYFEPFTKSFARRFRIDKLYYQGKTEYQRVQCFYNEFFGKILFLDEKIQSAEIDEYVYHESVVHPALITHPCPQKVLILGGGEGATIREVLRHNTVKSVTMVDIDKQLIDLCQKFLPEWSEGAFSDPKTHLIFGDARKYVEETEEKFDAIVSDLTEPVEEGPSIYLFTKEFFEKISDVLTEDGIFVLQAGSADPYYHQFYASLAKTLGKVFPIVRPYWTFVFSFGIPWGFILASKKKDPLELDEGEIALRIRDRKIKKIKFYHYSLHKGLFALPLYLVKGLRRARILTDRKPFIWKL